jgi:hypothetical protein
LSGPAHAPPDAACATCRFFDASPLALERQLPGLAALSSAHAASRAGDGYCSRHDRHLRATALCSAFATAAPIRFV